MSKITEIYYLNITEIVLLVELKMAYLWTIKHESISYPLVVLYV